MHFHIGISPTHSRTFEPAKKPLSLRQENSRAGAAELSRELREDKTKKAPAGETSSYSVARRKERTSSDSSQKAKLHVSSKSSSSLSGQFTDIKKVKADVLVSCKVHLPGEERHSLPCKHCQQPCLAQQGQSILLFKFLTFRQTYSHRWSNSMTRNAPWDHWAWRQSLSWTTHLK